MDGTLEGQSRKLSALFTLLNKEKSTKLLDANTAPHRFND